MERVKRHGARFLVCVVFVIVFYSISQIALHSLNFLVFSCPGLSLRFQHEKLFSACLWLAISRDSHGYVLAMHVVKISLPAKIAQFSGGLPLLLIVLPQDRARTRF